VDSRLLLSDLGQALEQLRAALRIPADHDVIKAGCIQYFEFCFELAWKSIRSVAGEAGQLVNSPKAALKQAFANGWIDAEDLWLEMLEARNRMSHTYDAREALEVHGRLAAFADAMGALADRLRHECG
jgi:nucleotidyltransferase substrate binding protein (TIGR01987 family)